MDHEHSSENICANFRVICWLGELLLFCITQVVVDVYGCYKHYHELNNTRLTVYQHCMG